MTLRVSRAAYDRMRAEATASADLECCGLLLGRDRVDEARPARNMAHDRSRSFEIDPRVLIDAYRAARQGGPSVIGYYHSHPSGPAAPSVTDRTLAPGDGKVWAIVGQNDVSFWSDDGCRFARLSYVVEDR